MKSTSFKYLAKQGINSLIKNQLMSLASIGVLVVCLLLVGASALLSMNVNEIMSYVKSQNEALVLADNDANLYHLTQIEEAIKRLVAACGRRADNNDLAIGNADYVALKIQIGNSRLGFGARGGEKEYLVRGSGIGLKRI